MQPLINQFTSNLSGCSGCSKVDPWKLIPEKEDIMQFQIQIIVEAENLLEAVKKLEGQGEVMSVNARPQPQVQGSNVRTGLVSPTQKPA